MMKSLYGEFAPSKSMFTPSTPERRDEAGASAGRDVSR